MIFLKITGFDKVQKELSKLQKNSKKLSGSNEVPFKDLFTQAFMSKHTKFNSISDFFDSTPFDSSDSDAIDDTDLDVFVSQNTSFDSWEEMKISASEIWVKNQLFS